MKSPVEKDPFSGVIALACVALLVALVLIAVPW